MTTQAPAQNIGSSVPCPSFVHGRRHSRNTQALLWQQCQLQPQSASRTIIMQLQTTQSAKLPSIRHLNRLRRLWGCSRKVGRPGAASRRHLSCEQSKENGPSVRVESGIMGLGISLFASWLEKQGIFEKLLSLLLAAVNCYKQSHPEASFPLLFHRDQTLLTRFKALLLAPLFGLAKLSEIDYKPHDLGYAVGSQLCASTLEQYLSQLAHIATGPVLAKMLPQQTQGLLGYIDGHMIPYWTGKKMHKGKITMLGRIMPGSNLVATHDENGKAVYFEYISPDIRLPKMILDYCQRCMKQTGLSSFVIDREINSREIARAFEARGWGLLSMLDSNEYKGLESFVVEKITPFFGQCILYVGEWRNEKKRSEDPRHFVIEVDPTDDRTFVFWATSAFKSDFAPDEWPGRYRARNNLQENSFKAMISHGSLNTNYGTKTVLGPDRHQQRRREAIEEKIKKIEVKQEKKKTHLSKQARLVSDSEENGHKNRLDSRKKKHAMLEAEAEVLKGKYDKSAQRLKALGEPKQRADRDFSKQNVMTFRTLLLENVLRDFYEALKPEGVGLDRFVDLFMMRGGSVMETSNEWIYWLDVNGLSKRHQIILTRLAEKINAMSLLRAGKAIQARVSKSLNRIMPPLCPI